MKTRREKLEELAAALKAFLPNYFTVDLDFSYSERKDLNQACLALSEPDAPEQTADDVWKMWELCMPETAKDYSKGLWYSSNERDKQFSAAYRSWKLKQKPPKVPVFEITDEVKESICKALFWYGLTTESFLVDRIANEVQSATAKEPT